MKKLVCLAAVSIIILAALAISCGKEESALPVVPSKTESPTVIPTKTSAPVDVPRYGGILNVAVSGDLSTFDEAVGGMHAGAFSLHLTNEELLTGDWAKGPAGTGETSWAITHFDYLPHKTGSIAESWEIPEPGTMIFRIRHGIRWALNPESEASRLVGGREVTAADALFALNRNITSTVPGVPYRVGGTGQAKLSAPDNWTLEVKLPPELFVEATKIADYMSIRPPEVVAKYGHMNDWRYSVGTGPFILKDYVANSSVTFLRNQNYWRKDPVGKGKGNQLPYLSTVKLLVISDVSTRLSAIRTAKIDIIHDILWEDAKSLQRSSPNLMFDKHDVGNKEVLYMRTDKQELPYKDVRVRRALMMATDYETIKNTWAGGDAQILTWPVPYFPEYKDAYLSLTEAPDSVRALYSYNPEKAKALLAEAGYPNGFTVVLVCSNVPEVVDYLSIIKNLWSKVNVKVNLDLREATVLTSISRTRAYDDMLYAAGSPIGSIFIGNSYGGQLAANGSYINVPAYEEARMQMRYQALINPAEAARIHKELMKDVLDKAWAIPTPYAPQHHFWWPWVKNYNGELSLGYDNRNNYAAYIWIDEDLKRKMRE